MFEEASSGGLLIRFSVESKPDKVATAEQGRPIFKDVEYIEKIVPGDRNSRVHTPVTEEIRQQFRRQYEDWKAGREAPKHGTPLTEWAGVSRSQAETLAFSHVKTVEELANVSDSNLQRLGPGYATLRQNARDFLLQAKDSAHLTKLRAENDEIRAQLDSTRKQMDEVMAELRLLKGAAATASKQVDEAPASGRRGR